MDLTDVIIITERREALEKLRELPEVAEHLKRAREYMKKYPDIKGILFLCHNEGMFLVPDEVMLITEGD